MMLQQIVKYINLTAIVLITTFVLVLIVFTFNPYLFNFNNLFKIENISIIGAKKSDPYFLKNALTRNFDSLINFDTNHAKSILEDMEWVKRAHINKIFPNTLNIQIIENDPFALFYGNKKTYLIDIDGEVITADLDISNYKSFLIVRGEEGKAHISSIMRDINIFFPEIKNKIDELEFIELRRWNLLVNNDLIIKLPDKEVGQSLRNLKKLFVDQKILKSNVIEIDLRTKGRATIKIDGDRIKFGLEEV